MNVSMLSRRVGEGNEKYFNMTLNEAQARVSYGALNIWQLSDGIQLFGPVSLVLEYWWSSVTCHRHTDLSR